MALKGVVDSLDDVPEAARSFYKEADGGKFTLDADGLVPKTRLDEFRNNNVALARERDELKTRFDGIDPDQARELAEQHRKQKDGQLLAAGKVDEVVAQRVGVMKTEYEKRLLDLQTVADARGAQLESLVIGNGIREAAVKAGVRPEALDDVLRRSPYKMVDGRPVPLDGDKPIYGKNGEPMQFSEWVGGLAEKAPHLFEPSTGTGAKAAAGGGVIGPGKIARGDNRGFLANLDKIATGQVQIVS